MSSSARRINISAAIILSFTVSDCCLQHKIAYIKKIKPSSRTDFQAESCLMDCSDKEYAFEKSDGTIKLCGLFDRLFPLKGKEEIRMENGIIIKKTYYSLLLGSFSGPVPYKVCYYIQAKKFKKLEG